MSSLLSPTVRSLSRISLPLMITTLSGNMMFLLDRLILAHYSVEAMNAAATAAMACAIFQLSAVAIASIAEVFVGQYNGAQEHKKTPEPVWQMIWFSLSLFLIFWPIATWGAPYFLPDTLYTEGNEYFWWIMMFGPLMAVIASFSAFFIGRGYAQLVTWSALTCNMINGGLNVLLVFGIDNWLQPMGAKGAAIATVISQVIQVIILGMVFLNKHHRETCHTHKWNFNASTLLSCLKVGTPSAVSHMIEIAAWSTLFRITAAVHLDYITVQTIGNSVLVFFMFVTEGLHKGVVAIASNLIGAKQEQLIKKLFYSGLKFHAFFMMIFLIPLILYSAPIVHLFLPGVEASSPLYQECISILMWVWLYFVFDGVVWILGGILTSGGDTRFMMFMNAAGAWFFAILPIYIAIHYFHVKSSTAWGICIFYAIANMLAFSLRYRSNRWKHTIIQES